MNAAAGPLVSIVIPTYNHAHFLGRALQSVLNQTYTNWEAIVIDNHSTDNTDEVMQSFSNPSITYLKIHNNGVIAASRNVGIRAAKGEWIAFLDSDDWWMADKLQVCIAQANDTIGLIYHDLNVISKVNQRFSFGKSRSRELAKEAHGDLLSNGCAMPNSSVVVRKALLVNIGGISEKSEKIGWEDYDAWLRLAKAGCHFKRIRGSYGFYWVGGGNVTNANLKLANLTSFIDHYIKQEQLDISVLIPWWCHYTSALCYQQLNHFELAEYHFSRAWKATPAWRDRLRIAYKWVSMNIARAQNMCRI